MTPPALRLFGERGYVGTTVSEIGKAAGLSPGAGGLYAHFTSKSALLRACLEDVLTPPADLSARLHDPVDPEPPRGANGGIGPDVDALTAQLRAIAVAGLARLQHDRDVNRILVRDLRAEPELLQLMGDREIRPLHRQLTDFLSATPSTLDPAALAAVLIGAISHFWLMADIFGAHPAGVQEGDYLTAVARSPPGHDRTGKSMKVLLAGATGAIGVPLVRALRGADHHVTGIIRTDAGARAIRQLGATAFHADVLDRDQLLRAVEERQCDAVVHEATALQKAPTRFADMVATNRLRTAGTANLLEAAHLVGARRILVQSIVFGYGFADHGRTPITEDDPFGRPADDRYDAVVQAVASADRRHHRCRRAAVRAEMVPAAGRALRRRLRHRGFVPDLQPARPGRTRLVAPVPQLPGRCPGRPHRVGTPLIRPDAAVEEDSGTGRGWPFPAISLESAR